jgi:hypothetical protein
MNQNPYAALQQLIAPQGPSLPPIAAQAKRKSPTAQPKLPRKPVPQRPNPSAGGW